MLRLYIVSFRPLRLALIPLAATTLGLAANQVNGHGIPLGKHVFVQAGDQIIEAKEAKERFDRGVLFLDARPKESYAFGHIPKALSLPEEKFKSAFEALEPRLRSALDIVVYCSGFGCEASHNVARKLKAAGIPAAVLHEGWPAWTDAGYPVAQGENP